MTAKTATPDPETATPVSATAQTPTTAERIAELEGRVKSLRAALADDRKTLADLYATHKAEREAAKVANPNEWTPRPCLCGCGQTTKGGWFLPGHSGRLAAMAVEAARAANGNGNGHPVGESAPKT